MAPLSVRVEAPSFVNPTEPSRTVLMVASAFVVMLLPTRVNEPLVKPMVYPVPSKVIELTVIAPLTDTKDVPLVSKNASEPFVQFAKAVPVIAVLHLWFAPPPLKLQFPLPACRPALALVSQYRGAASAELSAEVSAKTSALAT